MEERDLLDPEIFFRSTHHQILFLFSIFQPLFTAGYQLIHQSIYFKIKQNNIYKYLCYLKITINKLLLLFKNLLTYPVQNYADRLLDAASDSKMILDEELGGPPVFGKPHKELQQELSRRKLGWF